MSHNTQRNSPRSTVVEIENSFSIKLTSRDPGQRKPQYWINTYSFQLSLMTGDGNSDLDILPCTHKHKQTHIKVWCWLWSYYEERKARSEEWPTDSTHSTCLAHSQQETWPRTECCICKSHTNRGLLTAHLYNRKINLLQLFVKHSS